jgi:iron complex transport system ATP-binding protein
MTAPLLSCRGVDVTVGSRCLVRALDIDVAAGQRWALVGPNGAGKSTLLLVLAGARAADAGTVTLAGQALSAWSVEHLAGLRAMLADRWIDPFAASALDTVMAARYRLRGWRDPRTAGSPRSRQRAPDPLDPPAADAEGAEAVARECLAALDCAALADRDVRYLSRGERQRVALATALAQQTALVLLDEPISHQDPRHQIQVLQALQSRRDCTFIGALHDINAAARFATHALLLHGDGRWLAGTASTVLTRGNLSPLFETPITEIDVGPHRVFVAESQK